MDQAGFELAFEDLRREAASVSRRLGEQAATPQAPGDRLFSPAFMARHTSFESVEAFCRAAPVDADGPLGVQSAPAADLDAFVDETTDFQTWAAMRETAALEDAVEHVDGY